MRRLLLTMAGLLCAGALAALIAGGSAQGSDTYKFDVVFDDARGLIPGQLVKVAGAKAGTISDVSLTPDFKARVSAEIDGRFRPFHQNAACTIRPEGLIAENYIDCDPGNADSAPLRSMDGHAPTVPVDHTTEPVSLLNLFNIFNLPTRQRFMVLIDELGAGFAGEGQNMNDVIRRANPTLTLANQVIGILNHQRGQLATLVDTTNTVAAQAAGHTGALQSFLDRSAALTGQIAAHRDSLSTAVARLPGMLAVAQPALTKLDAVARSGTPLVQQLGAAAPALDSVARDIVPFANSVKPGLHSLDVALKTAIPSLTATGPLLGTLNSFLVKSLPSTQVVGRLFPSLQRTGFSEDLFSVFYYIAAATSRYDSLTHILPAYILSPNNGACGTFATTPVAGCSAHFGGASGFTPRPTASHDRSSAAVASATAQLRRALRKASGGAANGGGSLQNLTGYLLR